MDKSDLPFINHVIEKVMDNATAETSKKIIGALQDNSNVVMAVAKLYTLAVALNRKQEADAIMKECGIDVETEVL